MRRVVQMLLGMLVVACLVPPSAFAATTSYSRTTSVSGADAMVVMLSSVRHLEIGSRAATLTLELDGSRVPITVGYGELTRSALGGDGRPGVLPFAVVAICLSEAARLVGRIRRVSRV